jgi:hypothetical protein
MVNEIEPSELEKEKLQNSPDYKEITLVITILAGTSAFLLKLVDYFNNNIITISSHVQFIIYIIVYLALIEVTLIFSFLILKGYLLSTNNESQEFKNYAKEIFKYIFITPVPIIIILISTLLFYTYQIEEKNYYNIVIFIYWIITIILALWTLFYLNPEINIFNSLKNPSIYKNLHKRKIDFKNINYIQLMSNIILFPLVAFIIFSSFIIPSYLLVGHYSIEVFPESNNGGDMLTFTIEETGITYARCYITLYKLNLGNDSLEHIDNITIPIQLESKNKMMFGGIHELYYYLNVNTSTLSPGNYMLHAEVTNDIAKSYKFGTIKKQDDKLFYIEPKNTNLSSYQLGQK